MTVLLLTLPRVVLFDRDGTLVVDVPYNSDPDRVVPMPTARDAVAELRRAGIAVGVITNQSGIGDGRLSRQQVDAVNTRVDDLLGPFDHWGVCPHTADDACACRKPGPGMVLDAAHRFGVQPADIAVIGDIGSDMAAARTAGSRGILVPTPITLREEIDEADEVAPTLVSAVDRLFAGAYRASQRGRR